ncbi:MAG: T9SS type A sorting domain-containing protein [Chlorobi bacterium]|nr:T9SS type A sorting domain-containing protein [Chlorobiota bacterium]
MKRFTKLSGLLLVFSLVFQNLNAGTGANEKIKYVSPQPNANYVNIQHEIAVRQGDVLDVSSVNKELFVVTGSSSGIHEGSVRLSADMKTLIFKPNFSFDYNETISVEIKAGLKTETGINIDPVTYSFTTLKEDNEQLKEKFIQWQNEGFYGISNTKSEISETGKSSFDITDGLPGYTVAVNNNPSPGYIFFTPHNAFHPINLPAYSVIMDNYGTPVYYKMNSSQSVDFKMQETGQISQFIATSAGGLGINYGAHYIYDNRMDVVDTFQMGNGYMAEMHDFQLFNDGSSLLFTYDPQIVDMSEIVEGGDTAATVMGFVLQELDTDKNVVFEWSSWGNIAITEATPDINLTGVFIDYCHGNALERDNDGNILVSFRNTDEIIKIDRETGEIMWRLNAFDDNLNDFTFTNDTIKFSHQHDIRRLENGHITIFDNGNLHYGPYSRACEYALDEVNMTAELVWVYPGDEGPGHHFGFATGSAQRLSNGNTMIGWGLTIFPVVPNALIMGEVSSEGESLFEVYATDSISTYRALKFMWETDLFSVSKDTIDWGEFSGYTPMPYIAQVTNNSENPITIAEATNRTSEFFVSSGFPITIEPGATGNITVNYFPSSGGNYEDALTIMCQKGENEMIGKQIILKGYMADETAPDVGFDPEDNAGNIDRAPELKLSFDEKIFKTGGELITNDDLQDILSLDLLGDPVPFKAWITWYDNIHTEISIRPLDSLEANTLYSWGVNGNTIEDWAGNAISEDVMASFTTEKEFGINDLVQGGNLKLFPNPNDGELNIEFEMESDRTIWVYDINGKSVKEIPQVSGKSVKIDLTQEPNGVYFIKIQDMVNDIVTEVKTIKY